MLENYALTGLFVILLLGSRCSPFSEAHRDALEPLKQRNYYKLSGHYSNNPTISDGYIKRELAWDTIYEASSLWSLVAFGSEENHDSEEWVNQTVTLDLVSYKKIRISLYNNDSLSNQKVIHGKLKNGYFYRRRFFIAMPLIPALFGYRSYRYRIGLRDGFLVIDSKWDYRMFLVIAGASGKGNITSSFKKQ